MGTGTWDAEAMDIISAGAAAVGTITVGATGTGTTAGGGVTDTIIAGITGTITAAGGNPSDKGRRVGGPFFATTSEHGFRTALAAMAYLSKFRHEGFTFG
jgi:hypothetical protein